MPPHDALLESRAVSTISPWLEGLADSVPSEKIQLDTAQNFAKEYISIIPEVSSPKTESWSQIEIRSQQSFVHIITESNDAAFFCNSKDDYRPQLLPFFSEDQLFGSPRVPLAGVLAGLPKKNRSACGSKFHVVMRLRKATRTSRRFSADPGRKNFDEKSVGKRVESKGHPGFKIVLKILLAEHR